MHAQSRPVAAIVLVSILCFATFSATLAPSASALYAAGVESWEPTTFPTWQVQGATAASDCATTKGEGCTLKIAPQTPGAPVTVSKSFSDLRVGAAPWYISTYYRAATISSSAHYTFNVTTDRGYFGVNFTGGPNHNEVFLFTHENVTAPIATMQAGAWYHVNVSLDAVSMKVQASVQDSSGNNVGSSEPIKPPVREIRLNAAAPSTDLPQEDTSTSPTAPEEPEVSQIKNIAFTGLLTTPEGLLQNPSINFETLKLLVATPPTPPAASARGGPNVGEVTLSWTTPLDDGGAPISNYSIYAANTSGTTSFLANVSPASRNFTETGLVSGAWRYYRVTAWNNAGQSIPSQEVGAHAFTLPTAPRSLSATPGTNVGEIKVTWTAPASIGGEGATLVSYNVYRSDRATPPTLVRQLNGATKTFVDAHKTNGTTYIYQVSATNDLGEGPLSTLAAALPKPDMATNPTGLYLTPDPGWSGQTRRATFAYTIAASQCEPLASCPVDHEWRLYLGGTPTGADGELLASGTNTHTGHAQTTLFSVNTNVTPFAPDGVHLVKALVNARAGSTQWALASRPIQIGIPQPDTACVAIPEYLTYIAPGIASPNASALNYTRSYKYKLNGTTSLSLAKFQDGCPTRAAGRSGDGAFEIGYGGVLLDAAAAPLGSRVQVIDSTGLPVSFVIGADTDLSNTIGDGPTDCLMGPFRNEAAIACAPDSNGKLALLITPSPGAVWGRIRTCIPGSLTKPCADVYLATPKDGLVSPPFQPDRNADGYGDAWLEVTNANAQGLLLVGAPTDDQEFSHSCEASCASVIAVGDALQNMGEYRWQTNPIGPFTTCAACSSTLANAQDFDSDAWLDGAEAAYWNNPANDVLLNAIDWTWFGAAPLDPDAGPSLGAVKTVHSQDHDRDGILDGTEARSLGTLPETQDSDCAITALTCEIPGTHIAESRVGAPGTGDGVPDGAELAYWTRDGLLHSNLDSDNIPSNLLDPDSDGDGLLDGYELATAEGGLCTRQCTSPAGPDTDQDRLLDGATLILPRENALASSLVEARIYRDDNATHYTFYGEAALGTNPAIAETGAVAELIGRSPGAPVNLLAAPAALGGAIVLSWQEPQDHGGLSIQSYRVYSGTGPTNLTHRVTTSATTYTDAGLLGNTTYYYRVAAHNEGFEGNLTPTVSAHTLSRLPRAPTLTASVIPDTADVELTWTPPTDTGGEAIEAFRVYRGRDAASMQLIATIDPFTVNFVDELVPPGLPLYYEITTVTKIGESLASYTVTITRGVLSTERWGNNILDREPNTPEDDSAFMWFDRPDRAGRTNRVYFDAFLVPQSLGSQASPITGNFGTSYYMFAFFGNWVDCNGDGYIGDMLTARLEYSAVERLDGSKFPCPGDHIKNGVVREFLWINPNQNPSSREIGDTEALVWADFGNITSDYNPDANFIHPLPYGTTSSMGSLLRFADSLTGHTLHYALAYAGIEASPADVIDGVPGARETRYMKTIWAAEQDPNAPPGGPYVYDPRANNCEGKTVAVNPNPTVPNENQWPSFTNAIRQSNMTARDCARALAEDLAPQLCRGGGTTCQAYYDSVNRAFDAQRPVLDERTYMPLERTSVKKNAPNLVLRYQSAGDPAVDGPASNNTLDPSRSQYAAACQAGACNGWYSTGFLVAAPHARFLNQYGFTPGVSPFAEPQVTAYAHAGAATAGKGLLSPTGTSATYGAGCPDGWECNAANWKCPPVGPCVRYQQAYQFRDTDNVKYASFPTLIEYDENHDGVGDAWYDAWNLANQPLDVLDSIALDGDGANVLTEFRYLTNPRIADTDGDGWADGAEINYWSDHASEAPPVERDNLDPLLDDVTADPTRPSAQRLIATTQNAAAIAAGIALHPPSASIDDDHDGLVGQLDADADNDGLQDHVEYVTWGSYPEFADSDCARSTDTESRQICSPVTLGGYNHTYRLGEPGTGDGLPDKQEIDYWQRIGRSPTADCDQDDVKNILDPDSDDDGLTDGIEADLESDGCLSDTDNDGISDGRELAIRTNLSNPDTDNDGLPDLWEHENRPATNPNSTALDPDRDSDRVDRDGLTNLQEYQLGTNPNLADSDKDGLKDGEEPRLGTSPSLWDTDNDRMPDGWELWNNLTPTLDDAAGDKDNDGYDEDNDGNIDYPFTNYQEYAYRRPGNWNETANGPWTYSTNASLNDTDGDGTWDGTEDSTGSDARSILPSTDQDVDKDGLLLVDELDRRTFPSSPDTDGDGVCDGGGGIDCYHPCSFTGSAPGEVLNYGSNPHDKDTDDDTLEDNQEACAFDPSATGSTGDFDGDLAESIVDRDSDNDRLTDDFEIAQPQRSSASSADTDADQLSDYDEIVMSPLSGFVTLANDSDTDDDGLLDGPETLTHYTRPDSNDTDEDGLSDRAEITQWGTSPFLEDTDMDGMPDEWETRYQLNPLVDDADQDGDNDSIVIGLTNYQEYALGLSGGASTNPRNPDTDGDALNDYWEVLFGLSPTEKASLTTDSDHDGVTDVNEFAVRSNPMHSDTDKDGLTDWQEIASNLLPLIAARQFPSDPLLGDSDQDGLTDLTERELWNTLGESAWQTDHDADAPTTLVGAWSNLRDSDSDNDGFDDGQEFLVFKTNPGKNDTDGDGDKDAAEVLIYFTNPHDARSNSTNTLLTLDADSDQDGLSDAQEELYGTSSTDTDSDDDGMMDGMEAAAWGPRVSVDLDSDGTVSNLMDPDSDGDTITDGLEFVASALPRANYYITDPGSPDTDADLLPDNIEANNGLDLAQPGDAVHVRGAFNVPLRARTTSAGSEAPESGPNNEPTTPDAPGRADDTREAPDEKDTDDDTVLDGIEWRLMSDPFSPDTDGDGILDAAEPSATSGLDLRANPTAPIPVAYDADRDGTIDISDADDDSDDLLDGEERPGGYLLEGQSNPKDADTDDDGVCDGHERLLGTSSINPDADGDGLSDGLEARLGSCRPLSSTRTNWSDPQAILSGLRMRLQPYLGPQAPVNPENLADRGAHSALAVLDWDFDGDYMSDGIEDWTPNGILDAGESSPFANDTDEDGLPDSIELQVWGRMSHSRFLERIADLTGDASQTMAQSRATWQPDTAAARGKTNPRAKDTDEDGVPDGLDINPNGMNLPTVDLKLEKLVLYDKVDACTGACGYRLDPYFNFKVMTKFGTLTPGTPNLPELPINRPGEAVSLASMAMGVSDALSDASKSVSFPDGTLRITLVDDVRKMTDVIAGPDAAVQAADEIIIEIQGGDWDFFGDPGEYNGRQESDLLDFNQTIQQATREARISFQLSRLSNPVRDATARVIYFTPPADGSEDGNRNAFGQEDDAKLGFHVENAVKLEFLQNAFTIAGNAKVLPPNGGQWTG